MNKNATAQLHVYSAFFVLAGFVLNRGVFLLFLANKGCLSRKSHFIKPYSTLQRSFSSYQQG